MGGVEAVRGIGYQHAHAVLTALDVLGDENLGAIRVEGVKDVMDIEVHSTNETVVLAKQVKVRSEGSLWSKKALLDVMRKWAGLDIAAGSSFEFVTDGDLGPSGKEVRTALEAAAKGDRGQLATLLNEDESSLTCAILSRARVRQEATGVETVLLEAEREVRALLPGARAQADLEEQARQAVDRLYKLLSIRAGKSDDDERIVTRTEIAEVLGGLTYLAEPDRWPGTLRDTYLGMATDSTVRTSICPYLVPLQSGTGAILETDTKRSETHDDSVALSQVLTSIGPVVLSGRTGSGKTTATQLLRREAALLGKTVLVGHAETYVQGRLEALAADAVSAVVGRELPRVTGRQLLNDPDVLLVIDGTSEVPDEIRLALRDELRVQVAAYSGARVLIVGRDLAVLGSVLPTSISPTRYQLASLRVPQQRELVLRSLAGNDNLAVVDDHAVNVLTAQIEKALGEAAGNPMLFTMALHLVRKGIAFTNRVSIYNATIAHLAERVGAAEIDVSIAALGLTFAELLDEGRRYASPYEWTRLVDKAVKRLNDLYIPVDVPTVLEVAQRTGLVTPIGHTQNRAPVHDSYADYLAGVAHARRLAPLPEKLKADDEQRILFTAEAGGVTSEIAEQTARDLPFLTVSIANYDKRPLDDDTPEEVATLLRLLAPLDESRTAQLWQSGERIIASLVDDKPEWITPDEGRKLLRSVPTVICDPDDGPLTITVRLWRLILVNRLKQPRAMRPAHIDSLQKACDMLEQHITAEVDALDELVKAIAPLGKEDVLANAIGPFGLTALIYPPEEKHVGIGWPVNYRNTTEIRVHTDANARLESDLEYSRQSSVDYLVSHTPAASASARTKSAINNLTTGKWL
ncbi:NACHT domain-containing protein [Actinopolyspora erythraea]|uniref:ATP-binding protein n=1 Tax=Actinopolyspora erythraea TaxID=414996 RepID=UPI001184974E|nr:ATP-binding protein [Actinopolyspora erythraea]